MRLLAVLLLVILAISSFSTTIAYAENTTTSVIESWDVNVQLRDDGNAYWIIDIYYKEPVAKDDYWVFFDIRNLEITVDDSPVQCNATEPELGTLISCDDIYGRHIRYAFEALNFIETMSDDFKTIQYTFSITKFTDRFSLTINLPLGAVLADKAKLIGTNLRPFEPSFGREGSDGRVIFVSWELINPRLGESINARVIYEPLVGVIDNALSEIALIGLIALAILMVFGIFWRLRMRTENILPVLSAAERTIVETLDQRDIVKTTDFSKAKVSRVLKDLESRGIVEVTPKGRTKKIKLNFGRPRKNTNLEEEKSPQESAAEKALKDSLKD